MDVLTSGPEPPRRYDEPRYDEPRYDNAGRQDAAARYDAARYDAARYDNARYDGARPAGGELDPDGDLARRWPPSRRLLRSATSEPGAAAWRRRGLAVTALLLSVAMMAALRAGADPVERRPRAAAETIDGTAAATPAAPVPPGRPTPPFDHLPGRTPIAQPWLTVEGRLVVRGELPATGARPGLRAAEAAVRLVLGRYCRVLRALDVRLTDGGGWRTVTGAVTRQVRRISRQIAVIRLRWTGRSYVWQGRGTELARCS